MKSTFGSVWCGKQRGKTTQTVIKVHDFVFAPLKSNSSDASSLDTNLKAISY